MRENHRLQETNCSQVFATHRFDVPMQKSHRVDALDGLQDLAPKTEGCADAECSPRHASP